MNHASVKMGPGDKPGDDKHGELSSPFFVMPGLVPGIFFRGAKQRGWAVMRTAMTRNVCHKPGEFL